MFKYRKVLCIVTVFLLLLIYLTVPISASVGFSNNDVSYVSYSSPGSVLLNYYIFSEDNPDSFIISKDLSAVVTNDIAMGSFSGYSSEDYSNSQNNNNIFEASFNNSLGFDSQYSNLYYNESNQLAGHAFFEFSTRLSSAPYFTSTYFDSVQINDFYCWNNDDLYDFTSEVYLYLENFNATIFEVSIVYRNVGSTEYISTTLTPTSRMERGDFALRPKDIDGNSLDDAIYYVKSFVISFLAYSSSYNSGYLAYTYYPNLMEYDLTMANPVYDDNPAFVLAPYTEWLSNAVGGFMDMRIYGNFTLGGMFMTILAFTCCIWFLKLVAGG